MATYSFHKPREYSSRTYQRMKQYIHDAHILFDILQQSSEKPIPRGVPLPDKITTWHFEKPLSDSVLEKLAQEGYKCIDLQENVSDKAAE